MKHISVVTFSVPDYSDVARRHLMDVVVLLTAKNTTVTLLPALNDQRKPGLIVMTTCATMPRIELVASIHECMRLCGTGIQYAILDDDGDSLGLLDM